MSSESGNLSPVDWQRRVVKNGTWAQLNGTQGQVLGVLVAYANQHGRAWPAVATIAAEAGRGRRAVQQGLAALCRMGLICRDRNGGGRLSTVYRLASTQIVASEPARGAHSSAPQQRIPMRPSSAFQCAPAAHPSAPQGRIPVRPKNAREECKEDDGGGKPPTERASAPPAVAAGLFDAAAAVELLVQRGWKNRRDARDQVDEFGVDRVRQAVMHADFLEARGEIKRSYRGCVVGFLRGGWHMDERIAAEKRKNEQAAKADKRRRREQHEAERRRAELEAKERADELLWSQLDTGQRAELHRQVLARLPAAHPAHRTSTPDSRLLRPGMIDLAKQHGIVPGHSGGERSEAG